MLASNNILKPSDGRPVTLPSQDMIIGLHHLTTIKPGAKGEGRVFSSVAEAIMAKDAGALDLNAVVTLRLTGVVPPASQTPEGYVAGSTVLVKTTLGRAIFNEALPTDYPFVEELADKGEISRIVNDLAERYPKVEVAATLDRIKDAGFYWATRPGDGVAVRRADAPVEGKILEGAESRAAKVQTQYDTGLITDEERRQELIELWNKATSEVATAMQDNMPVDNNINRMVSSGARGNWMQVRQIAGMRGLVSEPEGRDHPAARSCTRTARA